MNCALAACLALIGMGPLSAAELIDADALAAMEGAADWPIVDVRPLSDRSRSPIPGALELGPELDLAGRVLVVASDDQVALSAARALESGLRTVEAYALAGGDAGLRRALPDLRQVVGEDGGLPGTFTIPSDTCQPGNPLRVYSEEE